jgi:hypothetical protein
MGDRYHNSTQDDTNLLIVDILEAFVHPEYDQGKAYFDVAIFVIESVTFSRGISPVCLPR